MSEKQKKDQEISISKIEIKVAGTTLKLTPDECKKLCEALAELFAEKQSPNIFINNTPLIIWRDHYTYPWTTSPVWTCSNESSGVKTTTVFLNLENK